MYSHYTRPSSPQPQPAALSALPPARTRGGRGCNSGTCLAGKDNTKREHSQLETRGGNASPRRRLPALVDAFNKAIVVLLLERAQVCAALSPN